MEDAIFKHLGRKLKYFRQRAKISQFKLEDQLGLSNGSLSRIENEMINPTKETMMKIITALKLSKLETDYLIGQIALPATIDEVNIARENIRKSFNTKGVIAYMVDDRSRVWYASKSFMKLIGIDQSTADKLYGESIIKLLLDKDIGIIKFISPSQIEKVLYDLFVRSIYWEMGFMVDDEHYLQAIEYVNSNPIASKVWKQVQIDKPKDINFIEHRTVTFKFFGIDIPLVYSVEPVIMNERFRIVQYTPTNAIVKLLKILT